MDWAPSHHAPRDRAVWLFLPAASWTAQPSGMVTDVKHTAVVGQWSHEQAAWIDRKTGHAVYPSMWSDAPVDGPMPDNPHLTVA